jgi:hypothetical protein
MEILCPVLFRERKYFVYSFLWHAVWADKSIMLSGVKKNNFVLEKKVVELLLNYHQK